MHNHNTPTVSVIIPCCNLGLYVTEAINSVKSQHYQAIELIVLDVGSDDQNTQQVLQDFESDPTITLIHLPRLFVSAARNHGIKASSGQYICCLDADDRIKPDYISRCISCFYERSEIRIGIACSYVQNFGDCNIMCRFQSDYFYDIAIANQLHSASVFSRDAWEHAGGYDETMPGYEDWELWLSMVSKGYYWKIVPEPLIEYRVRKGSKVHRSNSIRPQLINHMYIRHKSFLQDNALAICSSFDRIISARTKEKNMANEKAQHLANSLKSCQHSAQKAQQALTLTCNRYLIELIRYRLRSLYLEDNIRFVALYGCGEHTAWILPVIETLSAPLVIAIVDSNPERQGSYLGPYKVCSPASPLLDYAEALVLSTDVHQDAMRQEISALHLKHSVVDIYEKLHPITPRIKYIPTPSRPPEHRTNPHNIDMDYINVVAQYEMQNQMPHIAKILKPDGSVLNAHLPPDNAEPNNPVYFANGYYITMLKRYLFAGWAFCRNKDVLDTCCGRGWGSAIIAQYARNVIALDRDEKSLNYGRQSWGARNITWMQGDCLDASSYPHAIYDVVLLMESIEHFDQQQQQHYLSLCAHAIKDGGYLIGTTVILEDNDPRDHPAFHMPGHKQIPRKTIMQNLLQSLFSCHSIINSWMFIAQK